MSVLRKINICQASTCQDKGSKVILHIVDKLITEEYKEQYAKLQVTTQDCMGDCEQGPIVKVNDSYILREVDNEKIKELLADPEKILSEVSHVQEKDRETFERIIDGELF